MRLHGRLSVGVSLLAGAADSDSRLLLTRVDWYA